MIMYIGRGKRLDVHDCMCLEKPTTAIQEAEFLLRWGTISDFDLD